MLHNIDRLIDYNNSQEFISITATIVTPGNNKLNRSSPSGPSRYFSRGIKKYPLPCAPPTGPNSYPGRVRSMC